MFEKSVVYVVECRNCGLKFAILLPINSKMKTSLHGIMFNDDTREYIPCPHCNEESLKIIDKAPTLKELL